MYDSFIEPLLAILLAPIILPVVGFMLWRDSLNKNKYP